MPLYLCKTCGLQYPESAEPPDRCFQCEDERQYVGLEGQQWVTLEEVRARHQNELHTLEPGLTEIFSKPGFAIGQRAFLVESPGGNVLWDCIALLDEATEGAIRERGGLSAIAISHPHYYTTMLEWSRAFGDVPVYLHSADRQWVARKGEALVFWEGETRALHDGLTLIRCGGHFPGGSVLHWPAGAEGKGVLLSGDIIQGVPDRRWVSFMYSYPNYIPLAPPAVEHIVDAVEPYAFDRLYSAFRPLQVREDAKGAVRRSAERYLRAIRG